MAEIDEAIREKRQDVSNLIHKLDTYIDARIVEAGFIVRDRWQTLEMSQRDTQLARDELIEALILSFV